MKIHCIVALLALSVASCQTTDPAMGLAQAISGTSPSPTASSLSGTQTAMTRDDVVPLTFIDSSAFDSELQEALTKGPGTVYVTVAAPFNLNKIPPRLDKWLGAVKSGGGKVAAREDSAVATRSLGGVVMDVAVALFDRVSEKMQYVPATNYDATLHYKTGGEVEKVLFTHK